MSTPEHIIFASETEVGSMTVDGWLRAIIEVVDDRSCTVDDVAADLGKRYPSDTTVPVDDYVSYLVGEQLLEASEEPQHFRLTDAGRTQLAGILAAPGR